MVDNVSIPITLQIEGLIAGNVGAVISAQLGREPIDPRSYLTVTRQDIESYFKQHPHAAQSYFDRQRDVSSDNDIHRIETDGQTYTVAYVDHGIPRFERQFATLPEAVTEHLLRVYGMY